MMPKAGDKSPFLSHVPDMKPNAGLQTGSRAYFNGPKTIKGLLLAGLAALLLGHLTAAPLTPAILPQVTLHPDPNPIQAFSAGERQVATTKGWRTKSSGPNSPIFPIPARSARARNWAVCCAT